MFEDSALRCLLENLLRLALDNRRSTLPGSICSHLLLPVSVRVSTWLETDEVGRLTRQGSEVAITIRRERC